MVGLFDDDLFGFRDDPPPPSVFDEGYIPGWSVTFGGRVLGTGLSERTAISLCAKTVGSEIWGYGRTVHRLWPNAPMKTECLVRNVGGVLHKTAEYP